MENVVLVGFPGSGKTTIGQALATKLDLEFIDLDSEIEKRYHAEIPHIFRKYGEFVFRQCENKILEEILQESDKLIATGGGAPCYKNAMESINGKSLSIYIKMSENALYERLKRSHKKRPLTDGLDEEKLRSYINQTLEARRNYYEKASIHIDGENIEIEELAQIIKERRER